MGPSAGDGAGPPFFVVGHGFIGTLVAATVARDCGAAGAVFFAPAIGNDARQLPRELKKLRNPLIGPLLTGNPAHMADKAFASASPYAIVEEDMQVLRSVYMRSGGPGFAARSVACNIDWKSAADSARDAIASLDCPLAFATVTGDGWLPSAALRTELDALPKELDKGNSNVSRVDWDYSGHFIFDDAPTDSAKFVNSFIPRVSG
jgi:pimeloyl-ACP methyl ester carboxylesterase